MAEKETVDHPDHYNQHPSGVECIDIIEHMPFNIGTSIKHLWRCDLKHDTSFEDIDKAIWYLKREKSRLGLLKEKREQKDAEIYMGLGKEVL